ncbi:putative signal peptide and transmembrane protein [Rhodopirellula islandica]|uniref:Signal peptide and transmembrane protein n=1 Tax=Rhodopirellula islandica TaxID=595434 RepID=A0A0J1EGT8_RHOIS|nr:LptF/LptG family permease [Rhodopirellula islandica]KLU04754.1 putative signal peptide and transmembrane protein [Rhodopirellula islandica]
MTQIDRYVLILFIRTVCVCFLSLAGIFIVFHAFTAMDDLIAQSKAGEPLPLVLGRFYGPYLLLLFDMTGTIITLMAFLFTAGWLRRTGELTATLSAGISHGRILRPMVIASLAIVSVQLMNREWVIPRFRDSLTMKAKNLSGDVEQAVMPTYDQSSGILIEGDKLRTLGRVITRPNFRLYSEYAGFGDVLLAREAIWWDPQAMAEWRDDQGLPDAELAESGPAETASAQLASLHAAVSDTEGRRTSWTDLAGRSGMPESTGYLLRGVRRPEDLRDVPSVGLESREDLVILTPADQPWLQPTECFVVTSIHPNMLQTQDTATRLASVMELAGRVRNPSVHTSKALRTTTHERIVRAPLDFALILLVLPMVVNRRGRKLFVLIGSAVGLIIGFFALKTIASTLGGSTSLVTPGIAAWIPLLIIGPLAYSRLRHVQTV